MQSWQIVFLCLYGLGNLLLSTKASYESHKKKNAFGQIPFGIIGMFVWGDAVVFGIFWALVSIVTLLLQDWILFWLIFSLFWVVRSFGETIYWFNQQFSTVKREDPKQKWLYKYFHNDSVWFVYQITQQCITVVSLVASIYFASVWLKQF